MRSVITRTRVRFGETDAAGIVYYPTYFTWFDTGTHELIRVDGESARGSDGKPRYPLPLVECGASFLAPLHYDEDIEIESTVAQMGESSLRVEHVVRDGRGRTVGRGFEARVFVSMQGGRIAKAPIPDALRAHLTEPD
jgi:acyl-CoA thioester hydrolase